MATVILTLNARIDSKDKEISRSATIEDAAMPYFFNCYRNSYGQVDSGEVDENKQPILRDMTDEETFKKFATGFANGSLANVQSFIRAEAVKQVEASLPNVEVTPNE